MSEAPRGETTPASEVDWTLARGVVRRVTAAGPVATFDQMSKVSDTLEAAAIRAVELLPPLLRLDVSMPAPVSIVSRRRWAVANLNSLAPHLDRSTQARAASELAAQKPATGQINGKLRELSRAISDLTAGPASRFTGLQLGGAMAAVSTKVLGNFDSLAGVNGRLLLVAPNVLARQRQHQLSLADLSLWVCLHEQTHQAQFQASPWLKDFLPDALVILFSALGEDEPDPLPTLDSRLSVASLGPGEVNAVGLLRLIKSPAKRAEAQQVMAIMALLEGHATYMMNLVSVQHVPTLGQLRSILSPELGARNRRQQMISRLMGTSAKSDQYREGENFVRIVAERRGLACLNQVWEDRDRVPSLTEIRHPEAWLERCGTTWR